MKKLILCALLLLAGVSSSFAGATEDLFKAVKDENTTPRMIQNLIKFGADVNARGEYGDTPLIWAVSTISNPEVIEALINAGAEVNANDDYGYTPLILATLYRNPEAVKLLLKTGADVNAKTNNIGDAKGVTALMCSVSGNPALVPNEEIVKLLISAGADIFAKDNTGKTALDYAQTDEIKRLILNTAP